MAIQPPQYLQDKLYTARQDRGFIQDIYRQGLRNATDFATTATGAGRGLTVSSGVVYVPGTKNAPNQGTYRLTSDSAIGFVLDSASTYPRIDRIIARVYDGEENNTSNDNRGTIEVIKGVEANGATLDNRSGAQSIPFDSILLYEVLVGIGAGYTLTASNLRDYRALGAYNSPLFDSFQRPFNAARRDGVLDVSDATLSYTSTTVTIGAGVAWITPSGGSRTLVAFPQQTLTPSLAPTGFQIAAVIITPTAGTNTGVTSIVYGTAGSTPTQPTIPVGSLQLATIYTTSAGILLGSRSTPFANPRSYAKISSPGPGGAYSSFGQFPNTNMAVEGSIEGSLTADPASATITITSPGRYLIVANESHSVFNSGGVQGSGGLSIVNTSTGATLATDMRNAIDQGASVSTTTKSIYGNLSFIYTHPAGILSAGIQVTGRYNSTGTATESLRSLSVLEI